MSRRGVHLPLVLALAAALLGVTLLGLRWRTRVQRAPRLGGAQLTLERARWLHEGEHHGEPVALPWGMRRLSVELTYTAPPAAPGGLGPGALLLVDTGPQARTFRPVPAPWVGRRVPAGHVLALVAHFDVPVRAGPLRLEWHEDAARATLLVTRPPPEPPDPGRSWPPRAALLPPGDAARGRALYAGRLACTSCHGDPALPGDGIVGPALHGFAAVAGTRIPGRDALQYAYEAVLAPDAHLAPRCPGERPCASPSAMPRYDDRLDAQEMADLLRYLLAPGGQAERGTP